MMGISFHVVINHDNYEREQGTGMLQEKIYKFIDQAILNFTSENDKFLDNGDKGTPIIGMKTETVFNLENNKGVTKSNIRLRVKKNKEKDVRCKFHNIKSLTLETSI